MSDGEYSKVKGYIYIALATVLFSTMEIGLKYTSKDFNPMQLTMIRFLFGGIALLPFALMKLNKDNQRVSGKNLAKLVLIAFIGIFLGMNIFQMAVVYTNASVVSVLFSTNTIFVTILAVPILGELIEKKTIFALGFQIAGVLAIIQPWDAHISVMGAVLSLCSALAFAIYGVLGKEQSQKYGGIVTTCICSLAAAVQMFIYMCLSHIDGIADFMRGIGLDSFAEVPFIKGLGMDTIPGLLYVSIIVTGCGYLCYFLAMEHCEAQTVSLVFFFKPILAPILAVLLIDEIIPLNMMVGIILILIGSIVSIVSDKFTKNKKQL